ncbi:hypothetical protein Tco_0553646 [Tanacetum coccineum]
MGSVMDIKSVLTQKALDCFCETYHIPVEVHPQLPGPNQTIHEMPTGKIVARVSHFKILCRIHRIEPTVGLFRCFYVNSKNKGWMSFSKRPDSDAPTEFRADDYTFLAAHPAPFRKFLELFLCLIEMSRHYTLDEDTYPTFLHEDRTEIDHFDFIRVVDPTKVKVGERERADGEARLLETTVRRVVPLLPVAPARAESELDASVDKLFNESGGADQGDSATGGGRETEADIVAGVKFVDAKNVAVEKPKLPRKKKTGGSASVGKSPTALKQLFASNILNVESSVEVVATLPFVTSSVSATPEHESGVPADSLTGLNLRTIGASARFVISSDSSHHSSTNFPEAEGNSIIRSAVVPPVMTEAVTTTHVAIIPSVMAPESGTKATTQVHGSIFHDSESTGTVRPDVAGSSHPPVKELSIGSQEIDSESLHEIFIRDMDYDELFTEFSVGTTRQACLSAEVRMRTEYCLSESMRLESESEKQAGLLKSRDEDIENLKTQLLLKEAEAAEQRNVAYEDEKESLNEKVAELQSLVSVKDRELKDVDATVTSLKSQNDRLADQEKVTIYENFIGQLESSQDDRMKVVNDKFDQLQTDFVEMLAVVKCMNSSEYLSMLGAAISKAIKKGMQDGLSTRITHGKEGSSLMDVAAYNPSAEADYVSALQALQSAKLFLACRTESQ